MSGWYTFHHVMQQCMDSEVAASIGMLLLSCLTLLFKGVRAKLIGWLNSLSTSIKHIGEKKQHVYSEKINRLNEEIDNSLFHIGVVTDAARVSIWQFHNGESFTLSNPVFKLRSSFEYDRAGTTPDCTVINDVLATQCLPVVGPLMDKKWKRCDGISFVKVPADELPEGDEHDILKLELNDLSYGAFKYFMEKLGTHLIYAVLLTTDKGSPFGIITIQFLDSDDPENTFESNLTKICPIISKIRFALDNSRY